MDADEKNRYVLEKIRRRLANGDGFYGKIVLNCEDGRIRSHEVRRTYLTDELVDDGSGRDGST